MPRVAQHETWRDIGRWDVGNDLPYRQGAKWRRRFRHGNDCRYRKRTIEASTLTPNHLPTTRIIGRGTTGDLRPNAKVERRAATIRLAIYSRRVRSNAC